MKIGLLIKTVATLLLRYLDTQVHFPLDSLLNWVYLLQDLSHCFDELITRNTSLFVLEFSQKFCGSHRFPHQVATNSILGDTIITEMTKTKQMLQNIM